MLALSYHFLIRCIVSKLMVLCVVQDLVKDAAAMGRIEGLEGHARSAEMRSLKRKHDA